MEIETSAFGTLPTVIFQRLDVRDSVTPISTHAIIYESPKDALAAVKQMEGQNHIRLLAATDAVVKPRAIATKD